MGLVLQILALLCCAMSLSGCGPSTPPPTKSSSGPVQDVSRQAAVASSKSVTGTRFRFRDVSKEWSLDFKRYDDVRGENRILETPGGGVGLFDYDLDSRLDVFLTQGNHLPRTRVTNEFTNEFFRNRAGHLERVTGPAGLTSHYFHTGCAVGDLDEDGFPDLYVTAYGPTTVWHNNGDGTFSNISETSNAVVDSWSTSVAIADFNDDGLLDLFVTTYVIAEDDPPKICKMPQSPTGTMQCPPTLFGAFDDVLLVNDGNGGFVNVTSEAGINGRDGKGLGVVACDFDGDHRLDLFVANDGTGCFLYKRIKDDGLTTASGIRIPRFEECAAESGVALNAEGTATAAMGIAHGDYDRDGWDDLFVTNFYLEPNSLFRNCQGRGFIDLSTQSRLGPPSRKTLAFGTEFLDVDNDGWADLIVTTGHIEDRTWAIDEPYRMRPHLFRNDRNGKFTDVADDAGPYFQSKWIGRGLAIGDLDRDGKIDVVISQMEDPSVLLVNETQTERKSVVIRPIGRHGSPRSAIGVRVIAKGISPILMRDLAGGGSFQSASAQEIHLGLADRNMFDELEFTWPDGQTDRWQNVTAGNYVAVEGRGFYRIENEPFSQ